MTYQQLETKQLAEQLAKITTLSYPQALTVVQDDGGGREKAIEILESYDRNEARQAEITRRRERLRATVQA